jgi:hypothetical protein
VLIIKHSENTESYRKVPLRPEIKSQISFGEFLQGLLLGIQST